MTSSVPLRTLPDLAGISDRMYVQVVCRERLGDSKDTFRISGAPRRARQT